MHIPDQRTKVRLLPSFFVPGMAVDDDLLDFTMEEGVCCALC